MISIYDHRWSINYAELQLFYLKHSHSNVPNNYPDNQKLSNWVHVQRGQRKKRKLSAGREEKLEEINFIWDIKKKENADRFNMYFDDLQLFYKKYNHCNVTKEYSLDLLKWIKGLRINNNKGLLKIEKKNRLDVIGFDWDPSETSWQKKFNELVCFKTKHGHCDVYKEFKDYPSLISWVKTQRLKRNNETLQNSEKKREELVIFKIRYGHCDVYKEFKDYPSLMRWVSKQRARKKNNTLQQSRQELLDSIGFIWKKRDNYR